VRHGPLSLLMEVIAPCSAIEGYDSTSKNHRLLGSQRMHDILFECCLGSLHLDLLVGTLILLVMTSRVETLRTPMLLSRLLRAPVSLRLVTYFIETRNTNSLFENRLWTSEVMGSRRRGALDHWCTPDTAPPVWGPKRACFPWRFTSVKALLLPVLF
jgi:hypothetical protein